MPRPVRSRTDAPLKASLRPADLNEQVRDMRETRSMTTVNHRSTVAHGAFLRRVQLRHELYYDYRQRRRCPAALCCCSAAAASTIQLFTFLHHFTGSDISHAENSDSKLHNRFCCFVPHRPASSLLLPKRCTTRRRDMATPRLVALILATTCLWSVGDGAAAPYLSEARPVKAGPAPSARQSAGRNTASRKPRELYYHDGWRTCFINNTQLPSMGALSVDFMTLFR